MRGRAVSGTALVAATVTDVGDTVTRLLAHPVEAVLLDAGGVLLLPDPVAMRRALAPLGAAPDDELVARAHYASTHAIDGIRVVDWRRVDAVIATMFGIPEAQHDDAFRAIESVYNSEGWVPIAGVTGALLRLQSSGMPLAVVSNAGGTMEQQLLTHRICAVGPGDAEAPEVAAVAEVAIVVDSHVVGVEKPDPAIFEIALGALGRDATNAVYLGDTVYFDVEGARAAGLSPVHVDPYGFCAANDHPHVASLEDFVARLGVGV
jgi:putative hydrolase of the HAD superfamily